jgi:ABC-type sugar transport system permease subunit
MKLPLSMADIGKGEIASTADGGMVMRRAVQPALSLFGPLMKAYQRRFGANAMAYVFIAPTLILFGLFSFTPAILNIWISLTGGTSTLLSERPFVGAENYATLFDCRSILEPRSCQVSGFGFWTAMGNTFVFALVQVPVMIVVALVTALVLNRDIRGRGFWRALYFYPVMLSPVVVAVIWDWLLKRRGILNALLADFAGWRNQLAQWPPTEWIGKAVVIAALLGTTLALLRLSAASKLARGIGFAVFGLAALAIILFLDVRPHLATQPWQPINWLVTETAPWPFFWVVFVYSWSHLGLYMLILLAGLQAIPRDIYEAAQMDGTAPWRVFWRITLPLLMPTFLVVLVLSLIRAFQVFDEIYVLTGGGPGTATRMVVQQIYETAFTGETKLYGIAAAMSVILAGIIFVLTLAQLALSRKNAGA